MSQLRIYDHNPIEQETTTTTTVGPTTKPPEPKLQPCPGFCLLTIMAAFCERPNAIIAKTSTCQSGYICCDNTKSSPQVILFLFYGRTLSMERLN